MVFEGLKSGDTVLESIQGHTGTKVKHVTLPIYMLCPNCRGKMEAPDSFVKEAVANVLDAAATGPEVTKHPCCCSLGTQTDAEELDSCPRGADESPASERPCRPSRPASVTLQERSAQTLLVMMEDTATAASPSRLFAAVDKRSPGSASKRASRHSPACDEGRQVEGLFSAARTPKSAAVVSVNDWQQWHDHAAPGTSIPSTPVSFATPSGRCMRLQLSDRLSRSKESPAEPSDASSGPRGRLDSFSLPPAAQRDDVARRLLANTSPESADGQAADTSLLGSTSSRAHSPAAPQLQSPLTALLPEAEASSEEVDQDKDDSGGCVDKAVSPLLQHKGRQAAPREAERRPGEAGGEKDQDRRSSLVKRQLEAIRMHLLRMALGQWRSSSCIDAKGARHLPDNGDDDPEQGYQAAAVAQGGPEMQVLRQRLVTVDAEFAMPYPQTAISRRPSTQSSLSSSSLSSSLNIPIMASFPPRCSSAHLSPRRHSLLCSDPACSMRRGSRSTPASSSPCPLRRQSSFEHLREHAPGFRLSHTISAGMLPPLPRQTHQRRQNTSQPVAAATGGRGGSG
eukprot:TRINITY_DN39515_c0_g1_i1.p1 TRINITY_DN39515_c0_g1~~TRINITY_DN39515_c0_g1_i1.p1  ORF type:complete len:638 (-),score=108.99 TRINITY_DN39515_c0_g1_i1:74-1777(-)